VFTLLPKIFERSGASAKGSITGFLAVLVEGDDFKIPKLRSRVLALSDEQQALAVRAYRPRESSSPQQQSAGAGCAPSDPIAS
jgi:hypothetical protein